MIKSQPSSIAEFFRGLSENIIFVKCFDEFLKENKKFNCLLFCPMLDITSKSTYSNTITMEDLAEVAKTTTVGTDNINPEPVSLYIK